jgi:dTDP-4-amino-4,6-dideoxygalactose transaminase
MIPFSPPHIDSKITDAVVDALQSGWITTGPKTKLFEKKIEEYCDVESVLAVNSWTAGAELVLHWFGVKPGDEVIVPAYTYCATANIVIHCGAKPVMVDINDDFTINIEDICNAITIKTKAIISVDLGGLPVNYDAIRDLIEEKKDLFNPAHINQTKLGRILLLSDAAHSFGASFNGKKIGKQADFTVFSFHAVKNLTTAEGGGICINLPSPFVNKEIYKELNIFSLHGQSKDALAKSQKGAWEYDVLTAGYKCNMTDILASIGIVELERYETEILIKRKAICQRYQSHFEQYDWAKLPTFITNERESSYHLYLLRIMDISLEERNEMIQHIFNQEVAVNVHYKPLPLLSFYKNLDYNIDDYPHSKQNWETEITLPVYFDLSLEQVDYVVAAVLKAYQLIKK